LPEAPNGPGKTVLEKKFGTFALLEMLEAKRNSCMSTFRLCRGTLDTMLHHSAPGQWDPARLLPLVRSIARGMHHLHSRGIVHKDLKPG
jgi:serine/threonine protein kinase